MRALALLLFVACSSPSPSPGLGAPTTQNVPCAPRDLNPYGVCYPTSDLGLDAGQVLPNGCFAGPNVSFCLAQLYDPQQRFAARLIHIAFVAKWVGVSMEEVDFIAGTDLTGANVSRVSWATELPDVVFVDVVMDASPPASSVVADLQAWMSANGNVLTVSNDTLGVFFNSTSVPTNVDIDPKTMHILDSTLGFDTNLDQTLKKLVASL
jgi:hypothetical protein